MSPVLLLLLAGCPKPEPAAVGAVAAPVATPAPFRLPLVGLRDVACGASGCVALTARGLLRVPSLEPLVLPGLPPAWDTLGAAADGGLVLEGPCEQGWCRAPVEGAALGPMAPAPAPALAVAPALPDLVAEVGDLARFAARRAELGWRAPFTRLLVAPDGAPISLSRGGDGAGQLVRAGAPPRIVRIPVAASAATFPATLALHPDGAEAYVVAWPDASVRAFDPATLAVRWSVSVGGPAQGLFVDPSGRWLVTQTGPEDDERLVDWPLPALDAGAAADPTRDEVLRRQDRPRADRTVVVDLAAQAVAVEARGAFRRFTVAEDARLVLATDQELVFFTPRSLP